MIMIVTDGATETALNVFQTRNWLPNNVSTCHPIEVGRLLLLLSKSMSKILILDSRIYLHDRQRIRRSQAYSLDVMCK